MIELGGIVKCFLPSLLFMAIALRDLLNAIGVELEFTNPPSIPSGALNWIGRITLSPRLMVDAGISDGFNIWSSGPGWIPLEYLDIERWLVDVDDDFHLIICERDSMEEISIESHYKRKIILWSPEKYASFVGRSVLDGKLEIRPEDHKEEKHLATQKEVETINKLMPMPPEGIELAIPPNVDAQKLMAERGRSGISLRPIMIECFLWVVDSNLVGPNDEKEQSRWWIIEDPLSQDCKVMGEVDFLRHPPDVQIITNENPLDDTRVRTLLPSLLDLRRAEQLSSDDSGISTTGGLLRWWRFDSESAVLRRHRALLPGWIGNMPIDGIRILHGLSGEEYEYTNS